MRLFLAGVAPWRSEGMYDPIIREHKPFILESFFYADSGTERLLPYYGDFLLDSGAFTFMGGFSFTSNSKISVNFEEYLEKYADFINRNKVEKFFELDVDSVVLSFLANGERKIRLLNIFGSVLFVLYGVTTHTYSTTVLNSALIIVHIIKLRRGC